MDDISAGFVSGLNDELTEEENRRHWASLGNIAHRYPLKPGFWYKMEDISIEGATLYSFGIAPDAIEREMERPDDNELDTLPSDYRERLEIIKSAVRAGSIQRVPLNGSAPGEWDNSTRILKSSFLEWLDTDTYRPAEAIAAYPQYQSKVVPAHPADAQKIKLRQEESTHDSVTLRVLAQMFELDFNKEKNLKLWEDFAHYASRNGLGCTRTQIGGGRRKTLFDPVRVGEWLCTEKKMSQEKINKALLKSLPARSADLRGYFESTV